MSHLLPRFHATTERMEDERKIGRVILDAGGSDIQPIKNPKRRLAKPADPRVLRMIPLQTRGVGGTIPETDPWGVLEKKLRPRRYVR